MAGEAIPQLPESAQAVLRGITRKIPRHLVDNLMREEVDTSQEDAARAALKQGDIPAPVRRRLTKALNDGKFRTSETVVDEKVQGKIDEYHEREVRRAIRDGRLPDPKKDPFIKERAWRAKHGK